MMHRSILHINIVITIVINSLDGIIFGVHKRTLHPSPFLFTTMR